MRFASRRLMALTLIAGAWLTVSLLGSDKPTCQPVEPGVPVCLTPLDCEGLAHDLCVGAWQCLDATCSWACDGPAPGCVYDDDCAGGQVCLCTAACPACVGGACPPCTNTCACATLQADTDADGWLAPQDCDDTDASVNPAATEICGNGRDDDCDGLADEKCWPCETDAECPSYWQCASHTWCPPCVEAEQCKIMCQAWSSCEPVDPYPAPCTPSGTGSSGCPAGYECQCLSLPTCPYCDACYFGCVPKPEPTCGGYQSGTCPAGQTCECGPDPSCPVCAVCWFSCVPDQSDPCASEPGVGACSDPLTCQCRPPADCPQCSSCSYGCYPADNRCRFEADCWFGSTCDVTGTPDYCSLIMAPVLPPACWGTCQTCSTICPAVMCPAGQFMDPCTCKCRSL